MPKSEKVSEALDKPTIEALQRHFEEINKDFLSPKPPRKQKTEKKQDERSK